jgi:hypothetical protein
MKKILSIFSILVISSCTIYAGNYLEVDKKTGEIIKSGRLEYKKVNSDEKIVQVNYVTEKNFKQSKIQSTFLGKEMLSIKKFRTDLYKNNFVESNMKAILMTNSTPLIVKKGEKKKIFATLKYNGEEYRLINAENNFYYMLNKDGTIFNRIVRIKNGFAELLNNKYYPSNNVKFLPIIKERKTRTEAITTMSLTYNGIANGNIILNYMKYDLGSSNTGNFETINIPYKTGNIIINDIKLRILNANNQKIEFIVLKEPTI